MARNGTEAEKEKIEALWWCEGVREGRGYKRRKNETKRERERGRETESGGVGGREGERRRRQIEVESGEGEGGGDASSTLVFRVLGRCGRTILRKEIIFLIEYEKACIFFEDIRERLTTF